MRRIAIAVLVLGCAALSARQIDESAEPHVIVIGVDGLSIDGIVTAGGPALRELMARGAWSLEARGVMPALSSPNWMSMITAAGPEQHGITSNGYLKRMQEIVPACQDESGGFPNIFGALRAQRPASRIAIFHDWPGIWRTRPPRSRWKSTLLRSSRSMPKPRRLCSRRRAAVLRVGRLKNPPREPFRSARSAANSPRNRSGSFPTARPSSVLLHFRILLAARSLLANDPVAARHGGGVDRSQHSTDICGVA